MADFDDDDYYDPNDEGYGEEEEVEDELSPEDRASMTKGTADVRAALGDDASKVTVKQIEEALWHYYYDVDKSVVYLQKTFINPAPKPTPKKAPERKLSRSLFLASGNISHFANEADICKLEAVRGQHTPARQTQNCRDSLATPSSISEFFKDMPWLEVPASRLTTFHAPHVPRMGLLGGSSSAPKMSKLQALAAARKKKTEDKKEQEKTSQAESGIQKLSISDQDKKHTRRPSISSSTKMSTAEPAAKRPATLQSKASVQATKPSTTLNSAEQGQDWPQANVPSGRLATPSAFAAALVGSASEGHHGQRQDVFQMPYTSSSSFQASVFAEPSPDDVVLAAQAKAGKKAAPAAPKAPKTPGPKNASSSGTTPGDQTPTGDVTSGISNLKITDITATKSMGYDVVAEYEKSTMKKAASFVVVGHVDAGKSTLMGRLLLDLKYVDQRTVEKYRRMAEKAGKQSFALAWVMDQGTAERERGVTIDIATNFFETDKTKFTILDAPGHQDFVPNMIAGAAQADFAILVIDANTGAYEKGLKGQTKEHVLLLRSLGVLRIIVAVNKLDMVGWSKDRFDEISQEVTGFLTGLGFQEKNVEFIPISGLNGDNITKPIEASAASWFKGNTLLQALEAYEPLTSKAIKKPFRMSVSEIFRSAVQGPNTFAGRIDAGTIQVGDALIIQPHAIPVYVKSIFIDQDKQDWAVTGQNVSLAFAGQELQLARVGDIICPYNDPIPLSDSLTMKAMTFDHLMPMPVDFHRGRLHTAGRIQTLVATLDKATGEIIKKRPQVIQPGAVARVVVKLDDKVPVEAGQRIILRSAGITVAAGLLE